MNFNLLLKEKREKTNITLSELSQLTNISETILEKYEDGTAMPTVESLVKICKSLNITPNELLLEASFEYQHINNACTQRCNFHKRLDENYFRSLSDKAKIQYLVNKKKKGMKLYTAILQRQLGVGFSEALKLLEEVELEERNAK